MVGVHVRSESAANDPRRAERRRQVEQLGGSYHEVVGDDVAATLLAFADTERATQLVLGTTGRSSRFRSLRPTVVDEVIRQATTVDVHVVSTEQPVARTVSWTGRRSLSRRRQAIAAVVGAVGLALLTWLLSASRDEVSVATSLSLYLLAVVAITAAGGAVPGVVAALAAPLLANWFLIPPYHTFRIADRENVLELIVFLSVAAIVSSFVTISARRAIEAERARREASTLAALTGSGQLDLPDVVVEQLRRAFRLEGVAVLAPGDEHRVLASAGDAPLGPADADDVHPLASGFVVVTRGPALGADDHRVMRAFLGQLSRALEQQRLREIAAEADALTRADELRTAMLRAVSHDLRSPLASIKASVSSMRQPDVDWPTEARDDFLASIEDETDRLTSIVTNLLDLSRLEAGVLRPVRRPTSLEEIVPAALHAVGAAAGRVAIELPADLPEVQTDPALLDRVMANLVGNALRWSPLDRRVRVQAHRTGDDVQVHVIDHGPGSPVAQRAVVVQPFHRLDDSGASGGLGLGLAIADRFVAAVGGALELRDTPGGGLTAVVTLPAASLDPSRACT